MKFIEKREAGDNTKRITKEEDDFSKESSYEKFISEISSRFNIKKNEITLISITEDDDESPINDQDDLDNYLNDTKEFWVYQESKRDGPIKKEPKEGGGTNEIEENINIKIEMEIDE